MAISIDWGTRVINVPKADLTLIQSTPTEIREMNLDWFRLQLKDLEDDPEGMPFPDTHRHNTEVTVAGLTLARVIEIINGYTITFEDGQYAVNLVGANSNVADIVNVNQVSVRSFNSAGLISSPAIEYSSFENEVSIDTSSPYSGTLYPVGTKRQPVNNINDAILIAEYRGLKRFKFSSNFTFNVGLNITGYELYGDGMQNSTFTFVNGSITAYCEIYKAKVTGRSIGITYYEECLLDDYGASQLYATGSTINLERCLLANTIYIPANFTGRIRALECKSGFAPATLSCNGAGFTLVARNWIGDMALTGCTNPNFAGTVDMLSGFITLEGTNTGGNIILRGIGNLLNTSTMTVNSTGLIESNVIDANFLRLLGLSQDNYRMKDIILDSDSNLTSCTIRTYGSASDAQNDINPTGEYQITATFSGPNKITSYVSKRII